MVSSNPLLFAFVIKNFSKSSSSAGWLEKLGPLVIAFGDSIVALFNSEFVIVKLVGLPIALSLNSLGLDAFYFSII